MENNVRNRNHYADTATIASGICGVSDNFVRKVMRGDKQSEPVIIVVMELIERKKEMIEEVTEIYQNLTKQQA